MDAISLYPPVGEENETRPFEEPAGGDGPAAAEGLETAAYEARPTPDDWVRQAH